MAILFTLNEIASFGFPCGDSFISEGFKCWRDPKHKNKKLKKPIRYKTYKKIKESNNKAAKKYYRDREDKIRNTRRERVKPKPEPNKSPSIEEELKDIESQIQKQYWAFTRSSSQSTKPPDPNLYVKAKKLRRKLGKKELWERTRDEVKVSIPAKAHKKLVKQAIDKGEKIPPEVLKDYPEFVVNTDKSSDTKDKKPEEESNIKARKPDKLLELKDVKTANDREKYAAQELQEAIRSGDKTRIKQWEKAAKQARKENLNQSLRQQKQQQQNLFDTMAYDDDSPLLKGLFNADFASWQCGGRYIPSKYKCWTDEKGNKLKTPQTFQQYRRKRADTYKAAKKGKSPQTEYEKKLLQSVRERQDKIESRKHKSKLKQAAKSVGARNVLSSGIAEAEVDKLKVDPKRFQYKILGEHTKSGSVGSLTGVKKWDPNLAGIVQVWNDPKDGKTYVVNGHNRADLAKKLGVEKVTVKFIKADSPKEARAVGALTNIAEGRGNAQDAAKFFRDSGLKKQDLDKKGVPMREKIAADGIAMSQLSDNLFNRVVQGTLPEQRAVAIGGKLADHKQQQELVDLIEKEEKKGKRITSDTINELTDMVTDAPKVEEQQGGLLGMLGYSPESRSLAIEKAQLQASIKKQLTREKKLFGTVGKSRAASELKKAGNKINVEESAEISDTASKALDAFDKEKNLSGSVSNAVNRGAGRIAAGESAKSVEKEIYQEVLDELQKTYRFGKREGSRVAKRRIGGEGTMAASRYPIEKAEFGEMFVRKSKNGKLHQVRSRKKKPDTKNILLTAGGLALGGSLVGLGAGRLLARNQLSKLPKMPEGNLAASLLDDNIPGLKTPVMRSNFASFSYSGSWKRRTRSNR